MLQDDLEIHYTGFKTSHLHNLTELLQGTLVFQVSTIFSFLFYGVRAITLILWNLS